MIVFADDVDYIQNARNVQYNQGSISLGCLQIVKEKKVDWLVVFGFNATLTAKVISGRSVTHMCFLAFSHQY